MEGDKSPFTPEELRALDTGRLAVLNLAIQALIETHPKPQELLQAFSAKADAAKTLMLELRSLHQNPLKQQSYLLEFQELIDADLALWISLLERKSGRKPSQNYC